MADLPVVVIGAGVSGLSAVKACLEEKLSVVCYEKSDGFGGIWNYRSEGLSVSASTVLNSSKEWTAFSDFAVPAHFPNFLPHRKYLDYLRMYVQHFDLEKHLRFNRRVVHVDKSCAYDSDGRWIVTVQHEKMTEIVEASAVVLCAGIYQRQIFPNIPGLKSRFKGRLVMSADYKRPDEFTGMNVVVIGSGNTAYDTAVELGKVANRVYLSCKPSGLPVGRIDKHGFPLDARYSRVTALLSNFCFKWLRSAFIKWMLRQMSITDLDKLYYLKPSEDFYVKGVIINDEIPYRILSGQVAMKSEAVSFSERSVIFEDEDNAPYDVDAVIVAAGFQHTVHGLFDADVFNDYQLINETYRNVFPLHLAHPHSTLAIVGSLRPNGVAAPMLELQARWAAQVFSKKRPLPSASHMSQVVEMAKMTKIRYHGTDERFTTTGFLPYVDEVASEIGVKPNQWRIFCDDIRLWWKINFGQTISAQFRLFGPHACPMAKHIIFTSKDRIEAPFTTKPEKVNQPRPFLTSKSNLLILVLIAATCNFIFCLVL